MGHITDIGLSEGYTLLEKVCDIPVPSRDVTYQTLFLPRENLVSDIPSGDGNVANLYFTVYTYT